jgi:hypothetical protein
MSTPSAPRDEKLPYVAPVLKVYGDLSQLTLAKGRFGSNTDGALANNNKTV